MRPLLTLGSCSHECLTPRRRSKYSGADIMPSTNKGLGALEAMGRDAGPEAPSWHRAVARGCSEIAWAFVRNGIDKTMDKLI